MTDFSKRSHQKELLDDPRIPFEDIKRNMLELNTVNTWLGGHKIIIEGVKKLLSNLKTISICEIGCGGGDNLYAIAKWCRNNNINVRLTGIDINANCIAFAQHQYPQFDFICSDYKYAVLNHQPDIIFNSLFCHHFISEQVVEIINWMAQHAAKGFFISDLHRHPAAYYSIKYLTNLFSKSYLVKHDAPLSVLKGFTKKEWMSILKDSGNQHANINWKWAFRHLIVAPLPANTNPF